MIVARVGAGQCAEPDQILRQDPFGRCKHRLKINAIYTTTTNHFRVLEVEFRPGPAPGVETGGHGR